MRKKIALAGAAVALLPVLAACGNSSSTPPAKTTARQAALARQKAAAYRAAVAYQRQHPRP